MGKKTPNKAEDIVLDFTGLKDRLFKYFGCEDDYFVRPLTGWNWAVKTEDDFCFLSYWQEEGKRNSAVVVKKGGEPMIFKKEKYTMVIGIDCVKIGFIFENDKMGN